MPDGGSIFELVFVVGRAIGLALAVQSWAVKPFQIPSESMEPTLDIAVRASPSEPQLDSSYPLRATTTPAAACA